MTDMIENCCFASPSQTEPDTQTITRRALLTVLPMVLEQELSPAAHLPACFLCRRQKPNGNCPEAGSVSSYGQLPYPCSKGGSQPAAALLPNCRGQGQ